jgi:hypothetical protein
MSNPSSPEDLWAALGDLPDIEVDDDVAERVRRLAHAALAEATPGHRPAHGWRRELRRAYRAVEPVLLFGSAAVYVFWAFQSVLAGYR